MPINLEISAEGNYRMSANRYRVCRTAAGLGWLVTGPDRSGVRVILAWCGTRKNAQWWAKRMRRQWAREHKGDKP